ncbi:MAG: hypothetical protein CMB83_00370 [Flammeovirgaceae bacterium]|nr:hypothetical protein [Flammeovirgaceae bacterium]MAS39150.1 hypothetical protein [Flammeovirgaceae bacterium]|tara:strand:+ start:64 stop:441 length:378 start_codon:yes stop_codon:yes gene_type:complete
MLKDLLIFFFLLSSTKVNDLESIIESFDVMNSDEIVNFFDSKTQINIEGNLYQENNYKSSLILDSFFNDNDISSFNIIHKGDSEDKLIYLLGEYLSSDKIYKILIFVDESGEKLKIKEIKIDQKQ